jgi:hypothetical protein
MVTQRFDVRKETDGRWTVFDVFTALPANVGEELANGLNVDDARDLARLMNALDRKQRASRM